MATLQLLLEAYRLGGKLPSYAELLALQAEVPGLSTLLSEYRIGGALPTYEQLAGLAYL